MIKQTMQFLVPLLSRISLGGGSGGPCRWKLQIQNPRDYMKKKNRTNERTPKQDAQGLRSYPKSQIPLFLGE
ncbi:uncharacterized protein DFL_009307 [Arthrobotrys flagrans]|uniref:Uncharacterized protein n=1 Tax=Arthrobotrys flagrans TaxID=97331 RepID=A0A436ZRK4_ARTFL|nr:hypothetical protein DFL_009307 [Arthrobotrys flagrans]